MNKSRQVIETLITRYTQLLTASGVNIKGLVNLRKDIHKNAEIAFKEFRTQKVIQDYLLELGVPKEKIVPCAGTGLVVDIEGTSDKKIEKENTVNAVALRADIDALPMAELNEHIDYKSQTAYAHMCGHDGHIASLLAAATVFFNKRDQIPVGQKVRLLFQPAEESPGGALPMIKEGCLEGVDEVYGYHNWPEETGVLSIKPGPMMAKVVIVNIKIIGKGGHGSTPHTAADPILASTHMHIALSAITSRDLSAHIPAVFTIGKFAGGSTFNVIPDSCVMEGTIRSFDEGVAAKIIERITEICNGMAEAFKCKAELKFDHMYPPVLNTEKEAEHVRKAGIEVLGEDMVVSKNLPAMASEDFSYFILERPGAFFFMGNHDPARGEGYIMNHNPHFDFNDDLIPLAGAVFIKIVENRLGVKILN